MNDSKLICICPNCGEEITWDNLEPIDESLDLFYKCECGTTVNEDGEDIIYVRDEEDDELVCSRCMSNDLQNFGGCYICNDCGFEENII